MEPLGVLWEGSRWNFSSTELNIGIKIDIITDGTKWFAYSFTTEDANVTAIDT